MRDVAPPSIAPGQKRSGLRAATGRRVGATVAVTLAFVATTPAIASAATVSITGTTSPIEAAVGETNNVVVDDPRRTFTLRRDANHGRRRMHADQRQPRNLQRLWDLRRRHEHGRHGRHQPTRPPNQDSFQIDGGSGSDILALRANTAGGEIVSGRRPATTTSTVAPAGVGQPQRQRSEDDRMDGGDATAPAVRRTLHLNDARDGTSTGSSSGIDSPGSRYTCTGAAGRSGHGQHRRRRQLRRRGNPTTTTCGTRSSRSPGAPSVTRSPAAASPTPSPAIRAAPAATPAATTP